MSFFYSIAIFSVLFENGVTGDKPQTVKAFTVNTSNRAITYPITTTESVSARPIERLPSLAQEPLIGYEDPEVKRKIEEERAHYLARKKKHNGLVARCQSEKYIKVRDELGCELCTCIYEKALMLCSPYECPSKKDSTLFEEIGESLYNDYIIHVETNFSEYKCTPGEVLMLSALCDCACVAQDILSCPSTCNFGRKLY